ncbi:MAG: Hpt domain-containing protein, partial [Nitrosomonadales bacterium]|nr:Hpt domain-containing protein [Nitrosomonadales bacterium]
NAVKLLCRQIDQQLRSLSQGNTKATGNLLRDLLFYIAQSEPLTERIGQVKDLFELDILLPSDSASESTAIKLSEDDFAIFAVLRDIIANLRNGWSAIAEGDKQELSVFSGQLGEAVVESQKLSQPALPDLLETLHGLTTAMPDEPTEQVFVEVAASLNLLQDVMAESYSFDHKTVQNIEAQTQRLQGILSGDFSAAPISSQLEASTMLAIAQQIKDALQTVEQSLDTFFRNSDERSLLKSVAKPLEQVVAAFDMLEMVTPTKLAAASAKLIEHFYEHPALAEESAQKQFELVAESLSMLGFFVDEFPRIRPEALEALDAALLKLEAEQSLLDGQAVMATSVEAETAITESSPIEQDQETPKKAQNKRKKTGPATIESDLSEAKPADPELGEIFIAEAEEVLANVAQYLQALRINSTDREALKEVRRGYHTLKGSGRTVGLSALGEIAWSLEKLLNAIIENDVVPSQNQLAFIEKASAAYSTWIAELMEKGVSEPSYLEWRSEALALEAESAKQKPAAEAAEVLIGGTRKISR